MDLLSKRKRRQKCKLLIKAEKISSINLYSDGFPKENFKLPL